MRKTGSRRLAPVQKPGSHLTNDTGPRSRRPRPGSGDAKCRARCETPRSLDTRRRTGLRLRRDRCARAWPIKKGFFPGATGRAPLRIRRVATAKKKKAVWHATCIPTWVMRGPRPGPSCRARSLRPMVRRCGRLAPDPHRFGRTLLPGRRPRARGGARHAPGDGSAGLTTPRPVRYFCGLPRPASPRPCRASVASIGRAPHS